MPAPGVIIQQTEPQVPTRSPRATDTWFVVAPSQRGPLAPIALVPGMESKLGDYVPYSQARESIEAFFAAGGEYAVFSRVAGPAAAFGRAVITGASSAPSLTFTLREPGTWPKLNISNGAAGATTRNYVVTDTSGNAVESSPDFTTTAALAAWANANSTLVTVTADGAALPTAQTGGAFTGGNDDGANVTTTQRQAALDRITADWGPGQVSLLGATAAADHAALCNHAANTNRVALCDAPNVSDTSALTALGIARRDLPSRPAARRGGLFASWLQFPGATPADAPRTLPPSVAVAAQCAVNDLASVPISQPPAGAYGTLPTVLAAVQPPFTDAQRDTLNSASVNVVRSVFGDVRLYGFRSFTDADADPAWGMLSAARTAMLVNAIINQLGEAVEFVALDGKGLVTSAFGAALTAELNTLWQRGVFYGSTQAEAFTVDTSVVVNTSGTARRRLLQAKVTFTISGVAEVVKVTTTNIPIGA
jgi:hypothetical protein